MKIVIVSHFYPPLNKVPSQRVFQTAKALSEAGNEVVILTTEKLKSDGLLNYDVEKLSEISVLQLKYPKFLNKYLSIENKDERLDSFKELEGVRNQTSSLMSKIKSIKSKLSGVFDIHEICNIGLGTFLKQHQDFDVIISSYSPSWSHIIASKLKKFNDNAYWIADYRDLWSNNHAKQSNGLIAKVEAFKEKRVLRCADSITTVSKGFKDNLAKIHKGKQIDVIYNGYDKDEFDNYGVNNFSNIDKAFGFKSNLITLSYVGTLYLPQQTPNILFSGLKSLRVNNPNLFNLIRINFVGRNNEGLTQIINDYDLAGTVKVFSPVSKAESNYIMKESTANLLIDWNSNYEGVIPAKAFEYMILSKCILFSRTDKYSKSECYELLMPTGKTFSVQNDTGVVSFFNSIKELSEVEGNYEYIVKFERDKLANKLVSLINEKKHR